MINIFSVNTPFQLFMVRNIIQNYFVNETNVIVSSYLDNVNEDLYYIKKTDIRKVIKLKTYIKRNITNIQFFIPHTASFFSSYFFHLSLLKSRPINIYYEGMAIFYDPIRYNNIQTVKRIIFGLLCGIIYRPHCKLFPKKLVRIANACYSPISIGLEKYKKVIEVNCNLKKEINNVGSSSNLLILSPRLSDREIKDIVKKIIELKHTITYVKPHFELTQNELLPLIKQFENNNIKYEIVDKRLIAELFFLNHKIDYIISQHYSSALINIRLLFKSYIPIKVINEQSIPKEIVNKLNISL